MIPVPVMVKKGIHFECSHVNKSDEALKDILRQAEKKSGSLNIISVHGSILLNDQLESSVPEQTELRHIDHGLKKFMSKPRFDLVFYSLPENGYNQSVTCENLCYCRMLLKPGGMLLFQKAPDRGTNLVRLFTWKKSLEARMLLRAGYYRLSRVKMKNKRIFLCGKRPEHHY